MFQAHIFCFSQARRIIGDFGIPISILISVVVDISIPDTYTQVTAPLNPLRVSHVQYINTKELLRQLIKYSAVIGGRFIPSLCYSYSVVDLADCRKQ